MADDGAHPAVRCLQPAHPAVPRLHQARLGADDGSRFLVGPRDIAARRHGDDLVLEGRPAIRYQDAVGENELDLFSGGDPTRTSQELGLVALQHAARRLRPCHESCARPRLARRTGEQIVVQAFSDRCERRELV